MTQREFLNAVINANISEEMNAHAQKQIAAIDKRNATPSKAELAKRAEGEKLRAMIMGVLNAAEMPMTAASIAAACGVTTAKATPQLTKLVSAGEVAKSEVKVKGEGKKSAYAVAAAEVAAEDEGE